MYSKALEVGLCPYEFWDMSLKEIQDTVDYRIRQKNEEIYSLSAMIRVAMLSAFSGDVKFPSAPYSTETEQGESWKNSKNYFKALQKLKQGGAK